MPIKVKGMVRYLEGEPLPKCPFCLEAEPEDEASLGYDDLEENELACAHCGRVYSIRAHVSYNFDCYPLGWRPATGKDGSK